MSEKFLVREQDGAVHTADAATGQHVTVRVDGSPGPGAQYCTRTEYEEAVRLHDEWAEAQRWKLDDGFQWFWDGLGMWYAVGDGGERVTSEVVGFDESKRCFRVKYLEKLVGIAKLVRDRN